MALLVFGTTQNTTRYTTLVPIYSGRAAHNRQTRDIHALVLVSLIFFYIGVGFQTAQRGLCSLICLCGLHSLLS